MILRPIFAIAILPLNQSQPETSRNCPIQFGEIKELILSLPSQPFGQWLVSQLERLE